VIITASGRVTGLTTAVSVWVTAAIGMLIGAGFLFPAIVGTISLLITLTIFRRIESMLTPDDRKKPFELEADQINE
jgi:putative Mg2+ transporter-C (MgtC) family protein